MSKYRITLDGKTYEMEVELLSDKSAAAPAAVSSKPAAAAPAAAPVAPAAKAAAPAAEAKGGAGTVTSPMPGTVLRIEKNVGDSVRAGELVLVLEAMKMENEICAPADGVIASIACSAGAAVSGGEVLFTVQ